DNPSVWRVDDQYLAHLALTDIDGRRFREFQRLNRAGPGMAGASFSDKRIWNGNWEVRWEEDGRQTLTAFAEGIRFTLRLRSVKPPVIHGEDGVSRKAGERGKASHYVSFSRLAVEGTLNGSAVTGQAWMDHEWFTHQLEAGQVGWDWFSIQLDDGAELMLFQLRRKDGAIDEWSSGTYIDAKGRARHLKHDDFSWQPLETWLSPKTKSRYPVHWKIAVPSLGVILNCKAALPEQEFVREKGPTYWEGAVTYSGSGSGLGYLEMTGYAGEMKL